MNDPRYRSVRWSRLRAWLLRREPMCRYCAARGVGAPATTLDHIKPVALGGDFWSPANLAPACLSCNSAKGDTPLDEWLAGGCNAEGYGSFWDENQSSLPRPNRHGLGLHTKRVSEGG